TAVVRCDPVVRGPDVAPLWPHRSTRMTPSLPFVLPRTCNKAPAGQRTVSVRVDREELEASRSEWHGDGTAGENGPGSGLAATVPAPAMGEGPHRRHEPLWHGDRGPWR